MGTNISFFFFFLHSITFKLITICSAQSKIPQVIMTFIAVIK